MGDTSFTKEPIIGYELGNVYHSPFTVLLGNYPIKLVPTYTLVRANLPPLI